MKTARLKHRASRFISYGLPLAAIAVLLTSASVVLAQVSAIFDLSWHVIGSGGGRMESDQYTLQSTIGQPVVGTMGGSGHTLCSGFWCDDGAVQHRIYLPLVARNFSSTAGLVFNDDFSDGTLVGWTANHGMWTKPGEACTARYDDFQAWQIP